MKQVLSLLISLLILAGLLTGCGAEAPQAAMDMPMEEEMAAENGLSAAGSPEAPALPDSRKWVITCHVEAETEDLDGMLQRVTEALQTLQGYVENQELYNGSQYAGRQYRSAGLTLRVPAEKLEEFLEALSESANVVSSSRNVEDITLQYTDTETRLTALRTEEQRLLELMEQAESMADLLVIEQRLTEVNYEIENITSRLRTYDNQVDYATVHLRLEEVREYTPVEEPGFFQKVSDGFLKSLKGVGQGAVDLLAGLIIILPYLAVWALAGFAVYLIIRACIRRAGRKKKAAPERRTQSPKPPETPNP